MQMKKTLAVLLCALLLLSCDLPADAESLLLRARYHATSAAPAREWTFTYDDEWFSNAANAYRHPLARTSLGMALSAFRDHDFPLDQRDSNIREYLTQAGFERLKSEQYDIVPTIDTVATMIGTKTLPGGETLIAVAVSGGGYEEEWLSNFTVGDATRHEGFDHAAQLVRKRVTEYIGALDGPSPVRIWISGYSRAAAVSNLAAADLSDLYGQENVFAYTFATPRVTRDQEKKYGNIFNIVGSFDAVPSVPFAEWGYTRYGTDLFTPAQETDSDYQARMTAASSVYERLTGETFWNNVEANHTLHTMMEFLYVLMPTAKIYKDQMQDNAKSLWKDRGIGNIFTQLLSVLDNAHLLTDETRPEAEQMLDYLSIVAYSSLVGDEDPNSQWNPDVGAMENLAHEHYPDVYLSWLFSGDESVFTKNSAYLRLVYSGDISIDVIDSTNENYLMNVDEAGVVSFETESFKRDDSLSLAMKTLIPVAKKGAQTILTFPQDRQYTLAFSSKKDDTLQYFANEYRVGALHGKIEELHYLDMHAGEPFFALTKFHDDSFSEDSFWSEEDFSFSLWDKDTPYSPTLISMLENAEVNYLTPTQIFLIAAGGFILLLLLLIGVPLLIRHRHKVKKRQMRSM